MIIDPQDIFESGLVSYHSNPNTRYRRSLQYAVEKTSIDGLIFASSRGRGLSSELVAEQTGTSKVLNITVPNGLMTDHLPFLEYILRDKKSRGERLKSVLLLIDPDLFGTRPWTNTNIDSFLPPEIAGESKTRFFWRYLTAFQWKTWRQNLREIRQQPRPTVPTEATVAPGNQIATIPSMVRQTDMPGDYNAPPETVMRPDIDRQIALLERFVRLCRDNGISLSIATSPLKTTNRADRNEIRDLIQRLSHIVPLWNFSDQNRVISPPNLWIDGSHFSNQIGSLMIRRIYGNLDNSDFGKLIGTK